MQQDFDAELRIEKIDINPFVLSLRITGLELDNPEGAPTIRVQEFFTNFQLSSLFRLALTFDEVRLTAPELFVTRDETGAMDFSYLLPVPQDQLDDNVAQEEASSLIQALVFTFTIEDWFINWSDEFQAEPLKSRFGPVNIVIEELNTLPNKAGQQTVVFDTENSGTLSWSGDLQLNPLRSSGRAQIDNSHFPVLSAYIRHQTGIEIVNGSADVELDYEVYRTDSGQIEASIENLDLTFKDIIVNSYADGTGIDLAGADQQILKLPEARLTGGQFHWPEQTVSLGSISLNNPQIDLSRAEDGVFNIEPRQQNAATEDTAVKEHDDNEPGIEWQLSADNLAINDLLLNLQDRSVTPAAQLGITGFDLNVSDISNQPGSSFPTSLSLQLLSGGTLSLEGELAVLPEPQFEFAVNIDALQLAGTQPYIKQQANLEMNSGAINLDGHIKHSGKEPFAFKGDLEIIDLDIAESIHNEPLASWKSFRADKIALSIAKRQLDISTFYFDQLYGDILIAEDRSLNIGQIAKVDSAAEESAAQKSGPTQSVEPETEVTVDDGDPEFKVNIGRIVIADASANFEDLSLPLPFAVKVSSLNGKMTTISTDSNEPSEVTFEGKVDEFGFARISGNVTPLEPARNTDLVVSFENIDVPKFTPYSIPIAGREVASGNLDLQLGYQVKDSELVGENSIILRDFELGPEAPHPDAMSLPLDLAVALLKDADGKIDLDLPVRGNVDDPEFSYGDVIWGALGNLLLKVVTSPFAILGNLLGIEASELEHINFLDGRSDLTPPEMQRAGKLAEALALRPGLQLMIAGVYDSAADGLALRTAQFDEILELQITELASSSDPEVQYPQLRRMTLEKLFSEQQPEGVAAQKLDELRLQFTSAVEVEGQTEPGTSLDNLAYANELRAQLIALQPITQQDLTSLASARSMALKTALVAIDESLQERVSIADNLAVTSEPGAPVRMAVTLGSKTE